jgi:hypothetical protein
MAESLLPARIEPGEVIRAAHINEVFKFIKSHRQYDAGFISGAFKLIRPKSNSLAIENAVDTAYCLIENDIPACEFDIAQRKFKPGLLVLGFGENDGVTLLEWEEGGEFLIPMKRIDEITEEEKEYRVTGVNVSGTDIEADKDNPVIGKGAVETVIIQKGEGDTEGKNFGFFSGTNESEQITETRFSIDNIMDFRALPEFDLNAAIQMPYKKSARKFALGINTCPEG